MLLIGSLGGSIDTLLKPLYEDCLAPDTLIDGPDGKERIDVLAERGEPFRVWSLTPEGKRVAATAAFAFRKGYAEQFTYTLTSGRSITVTKDHRFLTPSGFVRASAIEPGDQLCVVDWTQPFSDELPREVADQDYVLIDAPTESVVAVTPAGWDYFYDMHVPGWENYSAAGIWNHNTILAWWAVKSPQRAQNSGWSRLFEYFQTGSDRAYTIGALMVLRAGFWATKTQISWKVQVADGRPFMIGDRGVGHFFLDDRVGLRLAGDNTIAMDRCRKIDLAWDADNPPEWQITIGDDRIFQDPAQRAWGRIERLVAGMRDIGVWIGVGIGISAAALLASSLGSQSTNTTNTATTGTYIGGFRSELVTPQTVRSHISPPVSGGLSVTTLDFAPVQTAPPTEASSRWTDVGVVGSEFVASEAVSFRGVSVSSVPNLVF